MTALTPHQLRYLDAIARGREPASLAGSRGGFFRTMSSLQQRGLVESIGFGEGYRLTPTGQAALAVGRALEPSP